MKKAAAPILDRLVLATNNLHKVTEIRAILRKSGLSVKVLSLDDFPKARPVVENRATVEGNARKKAVEVARRTGVPALADDTGLFIDALGGRPGVYSARFAGPGCTFQDNNAKVLKMMAKVRGARRRATFRCIAALALPSGRVKIVEGRVAGRIAPGLSGEKGFGYDPIFWVSSVRKTFAQMSPAQKNRVSHRGRAFRRVPALWKALIKEV